MNRVYLAQEAVEWILIANESIASTLEGCVKQIQISILSMYANTYPIFIEKSGILTSCHLVEIASMQTRQKTHLCEAHRILWMKLSMSKGREQFVCKGDGKPDTQPGDSSRRSKRLRRWIGRAYLLLFRCARSGAKLGVVPSVPPLTSPPPRQATSCEMG